MASEQNLPVGAAPSSKIDSPIRINRNVPVVIPPSRDLNFSEAPDNREIAQARFFHEPLVASGTAAPKENAALAKALLVHSRRGKADDFTAITEFLARFPHSPWRVSLLDNLGMLYFKSGYFSRALTAWEEAWNLGKNSTNQDVHSAADDAVGQLAMMNARIGRYDRLETLFNEIKGREILGSATELLIGAREGLWLMKNKPEEAFRCGPMALDRIRAFQNPALAFDLKIDRSRSTTNGMSLTSINELAASLGMNYQMAKMTAGSSLPLPLVVHWKVGHYAAIIKTEGNQFLVQDSTFREDIWISREALDAEASGYFLIPAGALLDGWQSVSEKEGSSVWEKATPDKWTKNAIVPAIISQEAIALPTVWRSIICTLCLLVSI